MRLIPIALIALIITGCTSSGGGDSSTPTSGEIGRRAVPGYEVIVSREATAPAGTYRVDLVGAQPQQVDAWERCSPTMTYFVLNRYTVCDVNTSPGFSTVLGNLGWFGESG